MVKSVFWLSSRVLITSYSSLYCDFKWLKVATLERACRFVYWVLAGTSTGLAGLRVFVETYNVG